LSRCQDLHRKHGEHWRFAIRDILSVVVISEVKVIATVRFEVAVAKVIFKDRLATYS